MKFKFALTTILFTIVSLSLAGQKLKVTALKCEYQQNPIGLDIATPRFSWKLTSSQRNTLQTAYEIRVGLNREMLMKGKDILWSTGKASANQSIHVPYQGPALKSGSRYYWQVRTWDNHGNASPWSDTQFWEMGILDPSEWTAKWIESNDEVDSVSGPALLVRKGFTVPKDIRSARAYITAHGLYEAHINGQRIGDAYLTPGWTSYGERLQYQVYDVTSIMKKGQNAVGAMLSDGWYRGYLAFQGNKNLYGKKLGLLMEIRVTYTDGSTGTIITDNSWRYTFDGPVRASEIYNGEVYDARLDKKGWTLPEFNDSAWKTMSVADHDNNNLVATYGPLVKKQEEFPALKIFKTPKGETVVDFGQNLVGWIQLKATAKAGQKVIIHHAEVLDKHGNFYTDNLRAAKQRLEYTFGGNGEEVYEPHFTFQGFRYVKVEGFPGTLQPANIKAIAVYSDMDVTGKFSSSHPLINQLQHNIQWGQKGNFVDVPTDCPQRDERLGWTGDAQVFARTAAFNMDVATFFSKWLKDLAADQTDDGRVPFVVPNVLGPNAAASAGWADAATIIPWNLYQAYGDERFLEEQFESMKKWVDFMRSKSNDNNLWNTGFHFGDWLFYRPFDDNDGRAAVTDKYLIAQAFFYQSAQIVANAAQVLGKPREEQEYRALANKVKEAFVKEYMTPSGRLVSGTQTAYVLALNFDLLPEELRQAAAQKLVTNIEQYGNHLTTGFLGTPYLCHVLTRFGYTDKAYTLLMQEKYPSWLYPVKMGATTIWERWDGIKPDSTFQTPDMNSFNHYAYGAIGDWMYRVVCGIQETAPGYKQIRIAPLPGGGLTQASAELNTPYGLVRSAWQTFNGSIVLRVTIPTNSKASIILPGAARKKVTEKNAEIARVKDITFHEQGNDVVVEAGSGEYEFAYPWEGI